MPQAATNFIVDSALRNGASLALEDLTGIGKMYHRHNGKGPDYRFRLNSWPHWRTKQMLGYKANWKGVSLISLTRSETYGSSSVHSACGEKLHRPLKGDAEHRRMLWCQTCKGWMDRDVNAAVVLSQRGLARFASSHPRPKGRSQEPPEAEEKGLAGEAVKGNPTPTAILRVDASKLPRRPMVNVIVGHSKS
jgi:IS605 OrfB family transposase